MTAFVPVSAALAFSREPMASGDYIHKISPRPKVITLCGSTRFMDEFEKQNTRLTLEGNVVFSVAMKAHEGSADVSAGQKELLDRVHLEKIRLSDEIFVVNVGGYVGESTRREIEFAMRLGKTVRYFEAPVADGGVAI